ncbi:hypothetical protein REPUB_Repub14bG0062500 [Reevesia pubescens]
MAAAGIVVILDFDKTIIDCDSDNWVVDELAATELFNQLLPIMPWNSLMDRMMKELHSQGTKIEDIVAVLKRTPIHPRIIQAIKSAHALGCDLKIVSDANVFFIETILEHHGLKECFSDINTNPSFVHEEGRLRIFPHHDFTKSPHGCHHPCPPNMCKLGDGDYVMPRKDFPVWDLICKNKRLIKAEVCEWSNGEEFERVLRNLISRISIDKNHNTGDTNQIQMYSVDCKLQTIPGAAHQTFSQALSVPH